MMIGLTSLASLLLPSESPSSELQRLRRETISLPEKKKNNLYHFQRGRKVILNDYPTHPWGWCSARPSDLILYFASFSAPLHPGWSRWTMLKDRNMYNLDSLPHGQVVQVVQDEAAHLESLLVLLGVDLPTHLLLQLLCSLPLWTQAQGVFKNDQGDQG